MCWENCDYEKEEEIFKGCEGKKHIENQDQLDPYDPFVGETKEEKV